MSEGDRNATPLPEVLAGLAQRLGVKEVSLRCDHENLETVHVSIERGQLVAHDRCETFAWIISQVGDYEPWSESAARLECERFGAELSTAWLDPSDDPLEACARIQRVVGVGESSKDVVEAVAEAIDAVVAVHISRTG